MTAIADSCKNFLRSLFPSARPPAPQPESPSALTRDLPKLTDDVRVQASLYHYAANVTDVYDGDTITVDIDLGLNIWKRGEKLRLWRINAPEVKGESRPAGLAARDYLRSLIEGRQILVRTILDKRGVDKTEKYGRLLAEVLAPEILDGAIVSYINVNQDLLLRGHALPMGADGSMTRSLAESTQPLPTRLACPLCGESRRVHAATRHVESCPNCLDEGYAL